MIPFLTSNSPHDPTRLVRRTYPVDSSNRPCWIMKNSIASFAMKRTLFILFTSILIVAPAAHHAQEVAQPGAPTPDDFATFFAGKQLRGSSPLTTIANSPAGLTHAAEIRELNDEWEKTRLSKIRKWAATDVHPKIKRPAVVKYMFGGPDFVHAATVFPGSPEYILVGMEPLGALPDFFTMELPDVQNYLTHLNHTLRSISVRNFFITKEMREDFGKSGVEGVYPVLLYFAALTGHEVLNANFVKLNPDGEPVVAPQKDALGIWLQLRELKPTPGAPATQNLYYFRTDLSNAGFKKDTPFHKFLTARPGGAGYLKAASFLMHTDSFSNIRNFLVGDCSYILQDASGIPADFFAQYYNVSYWGNYIGPIEMFSEYDQPYLHQAYRSGVAKPLPFGTGYRMKDDNSVQMLGVRK